MKGFLTSFQIDTKQWKSLAGMVKISLPDFNKEWRELAREVEEESEWGSLRYVQSAQKTERYGEESLEAGSKHRVSLGLSGFQSRRAPRIFFTGTGGKQSSLPTAEWQKRLCAVLGKGKTPENEHPLLSQGNLSYDQNKRAYERARVSFTAEDFSFKY